MDRDEIIRVLRAFEERQLEYVLIGASAMAFHGLVRATEDLDLFIRATPENIERLRQALKDAYADDPHIDEISSADLLGEYPAIRYYPPTGDLYLDVLTRLGESAQFALVIFTMKPERRVQKFRSIEEMNQAPIRRYQRGVFKFRTIEALNKAANSRR